MASVRALYIVLAVVMIFFVIFLANSGLNTERVLLSAGFTGLFFYFAFEAINTVKRDTSGNRQREFKRELRKTRK